MLNRVLPRSSARTIGIDQGSPKISADFAITAIAVAAQTIIYQRGGFTRILGATHILWLPMFAWMATRIEIILATPALANWVLVLPITNAISMIVDATDAIRFLRGERTPHYSW